MDQSFFLAILLVHTFRQGLPGQLAKYCGNCQEAGDGTGGGCEYYGGAAASRRGNNGHLNDGTIKKWEA